MTALRRVLVALLLTGFLAAWVAPASAEETAPSVPSGATTEPGSGVEPAASGDTETPLTAPATGAEPTPGPEGPGTQEPGTPVDPGIAQPDGTVTGAVLRWGINHESNNSAFLSGTYNFFAAGKLGDPGTGGQTLPDAGQGATWSNGRAAGWSPTSGNVSIQQWDGTAYQGATWNGRRTMADGQPLTGPSLEGFSGHQIVFGNGVGKVDPHAGTMSLAWDGDATVLYYSGMTFFYLSDPQLEVADGTGTLTAELSGFASSMDDLTKWGPVAARRVTVATFSQASITTDGVFQATPDYAGVVNGLSDQLLTGPDVGSFPLEFIRFQQEAGAAQYWYSSRGLTDRFKAALPVTVLVDPDLLPPAPSIPAATSSAAPSNIALPAPPRAPARSVAPAPASVPVAVQSAPRAAAYQSAGDHGWMLGRTPLTDQLVWWLLAAALLTMTASTVTASAIYVRRLRPTP